MKQIVLFITISFVISCNPFINKHNTTRTKGDVAVDEKAHAKNSLEWWYITGFMDGNNGKRYGIEHVFFSFRSVESRQHYMVNTAISCPEDSLFIYDHKLNLSKKVINQGLPLDLNAKNYKFSGQKGDYLISASMKKHDAGYQLRTTPTQPVVYHQDSGYVQYGATASAGYYSYPRLATSGQIFLNGDTIEVTGTSWYDRQWNGGDVYQKHISWDWTAINLSDSTELMLFRVNDGKRKTVELGGTFVDKDQKITNLKPGDITFQPLAYWTSPSSNKTYPIEWEITIPCLTLKATMKAAMNNQELKIQNWIKIFYWEGMCQLKGTKGNQNITGEAYLEMNNR